MGLLVQLNNHGEYVDYVNTVVKEYFNVFITRPSLSFRIFKNRLHETIMNENYEIPTFDVLKYSGHRDLALMDSSMRWDARAKNVFWIDVMDKITQFFPTPIAFRKWVENSVSKELLFDLDPHEDISEGE